MKVIARISWCDTRKTRSTVYLYLRAYKEYSPQKTLVIQTSYEACPSICQSWAEKYTIAAEKEMVQINLDNALTSEIKTIPDAGTWILLLEPEQQILAQSQWLLSLHIEDFIF